MDSVKACVLAYNFSLEHLADKGSTLLVGSAGPQTNSYTACFSLLCTSKLWECHIRFLIKATLNTCGFNSSGSECVCDSRGRVLSSQVTSLHHGLDRCAALLSGILQAEKPG